MITLALSIYNTYTDDKNEFYFLPFPLIIDLSPIGDATIISAVSKLEKYTIFFFFENILIPTLKKSF